MNIKTVMIPFYDSIQQPQHKNRASFSQKTRIDYQNAGTSSHNGSRRNTSHSIEHPLNIIPQTSTPEIKGATPSRSRSRRSQIVADASAHSTGSSSSSFVTNMVAFNQKKGNGKANDTESQNPGRRASRAPSVLKDESLGVVEEEYDGRVYVDDEDFGDDDEAIVDQHLRSHDHTVSALEASHSGSQPSICGDPVQSSDETLARQITASETLSSS